MNNHFKIILQNYLSKVHPLSEFHLSYRIGNPFRGETSLLLNGNGTYRMASTVTQGRQEIIQEGTISEKEVFELIQLILEAQPWEIHKLYDRPQNDDARIIIEVVNHTAKNSIGIWTSEVNEQPAFNRAQTAILKLINHISDGKILETGQ